MTQDILCQYLTDLHRDILFDEYYRDIILHEKYIVSEEEIFLYHELFQINDSQI